MQIKYGANQFPVPEGSSIEEIKTALSAIYPELANAEAIRTEDGYEFVVQAGTKGSDDITVVYGQNRFTVPGGMTDEEIKTAVSAIYPELANASATREENTVTFTVQAGTKGH